MFCRKCGSQLKDGVKFCAKCGNPVHQKNNMLDDNTEIIREVDTKRNRKKLSRVFGIIGIVVIISIFIIGVYLAYKFMGTNDISSNFIEYETKYISLETTDGNAICMKFDGTFIESEELSGENWRNAISTYNGDSWVIMMSDTENKMYLNLYVDGYLIENIEIDSESYYNYAFSNEGNCFVYSTRNPNTENYEIVYYDLEKSEKILIDDSMNEIGLTAISPDGKYVAYYEKVDNKNIAYIYEMGEECEVYAEDCTIVGLSEKLEYIYYIDDITAEVYVINDEIKTELYCEDKEICDAMFYFNYDNTQIMYNIDGGLYLSKEGENPEKIFEDCSGLFYFHSLNYYLVETYECVMSTGIVDFSNIFLEIVNESGMGIYYGYLDEDCSLLKLDYILVDEYGPRTILSDSMHLIYFKKDMVIEVDTEGEVLRQYTVENWTGHSVGLNSMFVDDKHGIYYCNEENDICYIEYNVNSSEVISDWTSFCYNEEKSLMYCYNNGSLFMINHGENNEILTEIEYYIEFDNESYYGVYGDEGYDLYQLDDNECILEAVKSEPMRMNIWYVSAIQYSYSDIWTNLMKYYEE